ncbi:MAG: DNA polymerase I [Pseudobdellovibrionaceae bacterium]
MKKSCYLVDVSSLFFRAFYAIRPLTSPAGIPVNAVYGFYSMIFKLLKEEKPDYLIFCYDQKEPSFRKEIYTEYKANRTEMPEDLAVQIPYIKKFADLIGIPSVECQRYEADDVIGTLVRIAEKEDCMVYIVSGDKDFAQLINEHVLLFDTMKNIKMTAALAKEKWGILPSQMIDYLALVGDSSDNVPGVAGIGPKGAVKLIEQFGTIENIYERLQEVPSESIQKKLADSKENAFLSKKLVTIECHVPIPIEIENYHFSEPQSVELESLLNELNFQQMKKNLDEIITVISRSSHMPEKINQNIESEVTVQPPVEEKPNRAKIVTQRIPFQKDKTTAFKIVDMTDWNEFFNQSEKMILNELGLFSREDSVFLVLQDQELIYFYRTNSMMMIQVQNFILNMKTQRYFGFDVKSSLRQLFSETKALFSYELAWDTQLLAYAHQSADCTDVNKVFKRFLNQEAAGDDLSLLRQHFELLMGLLKIQQDHGEFRPDIEQVYRELDRPLSSILYQMESEGIKIDQKFLKQMSQDLKSELDLVQKEIHLIAGEEFNIASPKQLGHILFEKLGLETSKKTKTGFSTDTDVLSGLDHPIAKHILEFREISKLKSTYVDSLPLLADPKTDRVHTHLNQALTSTGRLSSTDPNLQNIPVRTKRGKLIRKAFVADNGKKLLSIDYSQVELRILAHVADDQNLIRAFHNDLDIHTATAAEVFRVKLEDVTADLRRTAKAINFGIAYGQGAFGLAENLGISRTEAKDIINRYFAQFQGVQSYIESTIRKAHENGYVETLFGRRRYIEELKSKNGAMKSFGERAAINAPIQGTASDLIKKAMIEISHQTQLQMLLQVHDELIFEGSHEQIEKEISMLKSIMENVIQLKVPLKVNAAFGFNWDEAH